VLQAPAPVNTEVFLADLSAIRAHGPAALVPLINISQSPDYDNQPSFTPDSASILFTSKRDGRQTDIYRFDISTQTTTQLTHTPESEYSPIVTPDGTSFSVIRVEADQTQRLWRFDMDGSNPRLVLEHIKPVGYHAWIDATHLALFVLGSGREPATLQIADTTTGTAEAVASNIGHTILIRPGSTATTFVSKTSPVWTLAEIDASQSAHAIVDLDATEDFAWDPSTAAATSGTGPALVTAKNGTLRATSIRTVAATAGGSGADATSAISTAVLADLTSAPITHITRLAISPNGRWIAIVAEPVSK
jgi:dipeptidyl aminopeptidase/acylaminoacyl peptidase